MAIYKTITIGQNSKLLLWKIEESLEQLYNGLELTPESVERLNNMKSLVHKKGYLAVRQLLKEFGYTDSDLNYKSSGRPLLINGKHITISHSHNFAAVLVGDKAFGVDIEKQREKIIRIANKFTPISEYRTLANDDAIIRKLTLVWAAKESVYKSFSTHGVSFLNHIDVHDFDLDSPRTQATLEFKGKVQEYEVFFLEFEDFACSYVYPKLPASS
ncbi:MAG TPA: 4'-phosphopantetheinyl transferase superfamily protein [Flavobacteriaceae bacterium]|nr:4'-phosphopantetheinyl transferase superfamily protein [Flavobacteriaceae bacterium]